MSYDYESGRWVEDADLRRKQLLQERELIAGPTGRVYLAYIGSKQTVEQALAEIDSQL